SVPCAPFRYPRSLSSIHRHPIRHRLRRHTNRDGFVLGAHDDEGVLDVVAVAGAGDAAEVGARGIDAAAHAGEVFRAVAQAVAAALRTPISDADSCAQWVRHPGDKDGVMTAAAGAPELEEVALLHFVPIG